MQSWSIKTEVIINSAKISRYEAFKFICVCSTWLIVVYGLHAVPGPLAVIRLESVRLYKSILAWKVVGKSLGSRWKVVIYIFFDGICFWKSLAVMFNPVQSASPLISNHNYCFNFVNQLQCLNAMIYITHCPCHILLIIIL